jgi:hypothetical protein
MITEKRIGKIVTAPMTMRAGAVNPQPSLASCRRKTSCLPGREGAGRAMPVVVLRVVITLLSQGRAG